MWQRLCAEVIDSNAKISLIDESTTVYSKSVLILYLHTFVCHEVMTFFLDLVEFDGSDAGTITATLLKTVAAQEFTKDFLTNNLVGLCSDGVSVMVGQKSCALTLLAAYRLCLSYINDV